MVLVVRKARFFRLSLIPFPTFTRHLSTYDGSLVLLSRYINLVYKDLNSNHQFSVPPLILEGIKHKILSDSYTLAPIQVQFMENRDQLYQFLQEKKVDCPDIMYGASRNSEKAFAMIPNNKGDTLVLMALAVMLLRLSRGSSRFRMVDLVEDFHSNLKLKGQVNRVHKVDVQHSLGTIPISFVEEKIQSLVGDSSPIFKLVSTFLRLPIIDNDGNNWKGKHNFTGIPVVGEITKVLFNIYLMDTIDKDFPLRYPGIAFTRFMNEIYLFTREKVIFDCQDVHELLWQHCLLGSMTTIGPEDDPLNCHFNKLLYLSSKGKVILCDPQDYFDKHQKLCSFLTGLFHRYTIFFIFSLVVLISFVFRSEMNPCLISFLVILVFLV